MDCFETKFPKSDESKNTDKNEVAHRIRTTCLVPESLGLLRSNTRLGEITKQLGVKDRVELTNSEGEKVQITKQENGGYFVNRYLPEVPSGVQLIGNVELDTRGNAIRGQRYQLDGNVFMEGPTVGLLLEVAKLDEALIPNRKTQQTVNARRNLK